MSKSVAAAATAPRAKTLARNKILNAKDKVQAADEAQPVPHEQAPAHLVATHDAAMITVAEGSLEGDLSFAQVLSDAQVSAASFYADAGMATMGGSSLLQDGSSGSGSSEGSDNTALYVVGGAVLLGGGIALIASGGDDDAANRAPTAAASATLKATTATAATGSVGATDPDGDALTYTASTPTNGTVQIGSDGKYTYTSKGGFTGTDSFTVTVKDPGGLTATQKVDVTIAAAGPSTAAIAVNAAGSVSDADNVNTTYTVSLGNYTYTIDGFDKGGDKIVSPAGVPVGLNNSSFTDGKVEIEYASGGQVAKIVLTGLSAADDAKIFGTSDLNTVFGAGTFA